MHIWQSPSYSIIHCLELVFKLLLLCSVHVGDTANIVTSMAVDGDHVLTGRVQIGQQVLSALLSI